LKAFCKSVYICRSYDQTSKYIVFFLRHSVHGGPKVSYYGVNNTKIQYKSTGFTGIMYILMNKNL